MLTLLHNSLGTYTVKNQRMLQNKVLGHCKNIDHIAYCFEVKQFSVCLLLFEFYFYFFQPHNSPQLQVVLRT